MRSLRVFTWRSVLLVTAASTLFANVPVLSCVCVAAPAPVQEAAPTCCCGTGCCVIADSEAPCCGPATPARDSSDELAIGAPAIGAPECKSTPTPTLTLVVEHRSVQIDDVRIACESMDVDSYAVILGAIPFPRNWHVYNLPPPTDLIVALHHFVI